VPHHPSLVEVLQARCNYEWLEVDISGFFFGDFVDAQNGKGNVSSPSFYLISAPAQSEYGTFSFAKATIYMEQVRESELQNLIGDMPLGSFNFYEEESAGITVKVSNKIYNNLFDLLTNNMENISLKIAIPKWSDTEAKCLPLLKYQLTYEQERVDVNS